MKSYRTHINPEAWMPTPVVIEDRTVPSQPVDYGHFSGQDETIRCVRCADDFAFTAREQAFYASKGFRDKPRRCKACRAKRKADNGR